MMHFEGPGIVNTAKTLEIAFDCALTRGVRDIIVASTDFIAVAGTGQGADTACIVKGDCSSRFFRIKIREILVKPREF
jgi:hypothetical protein